MLKLWQNSKEKVIHQNVGNVEEAKSVKEATEKVIQSHVEESDCDRWEQLIRLI